ncbi:MAG: efflux RND transporter periplasmic adaptor subunit [Vibrionaceae bacterium]
MKIKLLVLSVAFALPPLPLSAMQAGSAAHSEHTHAKHAPAPQAHDTPSLANSTSSTHYICPMHPQIIKDEPGTCPLCSMALEPIELQQNAAVNLQVSGAMQQALAIRTAPAKLGTLWKYTRTVGQVEYDQSKLLNLHARVSGWIEKLNVNSAGDKVKKGQLLYELYSPELITAQDDYLLAQKTAHRSGNQDYKNLLNSAAQRLALLGISKQQIAQIAKSGKKMHKVPFFAPEDGVIAALNVREGMYIQPQTQILSLVDLSNVWVIADVFESDQSWITVGQQAEISLAAHDLHNVQGKIDYIYPELDPVTRSLKVRINVPNLATHLRPKSLVNVALFGGALRNVLTVPQEALIQTGKENRLIIQKDDGSFVAKNVTVGLISQNKAQITKGVEVDESVVVSGQFLLDSEASLKASLLRLTSAKASQEQTHAH